MSARKPARKPAKRRLRKRRQRRTLTPPPYVPSPTAIRAGCAEIRETWSEQIHQARGWKRTVPFSWPCVAGSDLAGAIRDDMDSDAEN